METDIPTLSPLVTSPDFTISNIGMDQSGMDKACAFLRDKIYSDKILATVRETLTNAIDEHVKHSIDRPVETGIRINDQGKYEFYVRDFAKGLSDENLRNVFGMYFRSTKSNSNDMIGGFGLGAKAPSCYNDTFFVNSYYEGVKTCYMFTMGANDRGSSVVQILDLSREDTTESGLEVFIEVKYSDLTTFDNKIKSLVYFCNTPVEYINFGSDAVVPLVPENIITKNGFTFKFYASPFYGAPRETYLQMGNVNYEKGAGYSILGSNDNKTSPKSSTVVVDIPIGKMSLPISRESFEETSSNNRVKDDISNAFAEIVSDDLKQFQGKSLKDLISEKGELYFEGTMFKQHKSILYPDLFSFVSRLSRANHITISEDNAETFKNKKLLALIPDKRTAEMWRGRLVDKSIGQNKSYYYINDVVWEQFGKDCPEIVDMFIPKKVNSRFFGLGYINNNNNDNDDDIDEDVQKYYTPYSIKSPGRSNGHGITTMSALQTHNNARKNIGLDPAADVVEAKKQMEEMRGQGINCFDTYEKLNQFTIYKSASHEAYWTTNSKKLHDAIASLGWISLDDSDDYTFRKKIYDEITKKQTEERKLRDFIQGSLPSFIKSDYVNKVQSRLRRYPKYAERMYDILNNIRNIENSTRSRVLKNLSKASIYYDADRLTRSDLRKILTLK